MEDLLTPILCHILLCVLLYVLLTVVRSPTVWGFGFKIGYLNAFQNIQPKVSANLSNQFEWPMLFYVVCVILITSGSTITNTQLYLAWLFVMGRYLHSFVQIFTSSIRLRGIVFTVNFVAVIAMWGVLFIESSGT